MAATADTAGRIDQNETRPLLRGRIKASRVGPFFRRARLRLARHLRPRGGGRVGKPTAVPVTKQKNKKRAPRLTSKSRREAHDERKSLMNESTSNTSTTALHYARQAVAILEAAEAEGLPMPNSVGASRFEEVDFNLTVCNRDEFHEWAAFIKAPYVLYADMNGTSNTYAEGEVDGVRVLIFTSGIAPDQARRVSVVYHLDDHGTARCQDIGRRSFIGVQETASALTWHRIEGADSRVWQDPETRACPECAGVLAADALKAMEPQSGVSDETLAEGARVSADYNARGGNDGIIPEAPRRGDILNEEWPAGCNLAVGDYVCTRHVNYTHVAGGFAEVLAVRSFTVAEMDEARKAAEALS